MGTITDLDVIDIRFPTSRTLDGSDAMNPDPDYSAAYVVLRTDDADGLTGHGLTFTIGRGTEVVVAGVKALRPLVVGRSTDDIFPAMGAFWRSLVSTSAIRNSFQAKIRTMRKVATRPGTEIGRTIDRTMR